MDLLTLLRVLWRRWVVFVPLIVLTMAVAWQVPRDYKRPYEASVTVLLLEPPPVAVAGQPPPATRNPYLHISSSLATFATVFEAAMNDRQTAQRLADAGLSDEAHIAVVNLTGDGRSSEAATSPLLQALVRTTDPGAAANDLNLVRAEIDARLVELQQGRANEPLDPNLQIRASVIGQSADPYPLAAGRTRPTAAILAVGGGLSLWLTLVVDRRRRPPAAAKAPLAPGARGGRPEPARVLIPSPG